VTTGRWNPDASQSRRGPASPAQPSLESVIAHTANRARAPLPQVLLTDLLGLRSPRRSSEAMAASPKISLPTTLGVSEPGCRDGSGIAESIFSFGSVPSGRSGRLLAGLRGFDLR
jgi:hypothetical protein